MRVLVKLYNMVDPAADGSVIPRQQTEQYLNSEDYRTIISDRLALCGFTHKDRVLNSEYKNVVGPDDQVLINSNAVGHIEKIFLRENGDKYCYAIIRVFDPDKFSGTLHDNIVNFRGMMEEGVKLPSSVVIQAMWSPSGRAERIIRIKGMDFTMNPSFKGSGTVKMMSVKEEEDTSDTKRFSYKGDVPEGLKVTTKRFSMGELEVTKLLDDDRQIVLPNPLEGMPDDKSLTRDDIISMFGKGSDADICTRNMPVVKVKIVRTIVDGSLGNQLDLPKKLLLDEIREGNENDLDNLLKSNSSKVIEIMTTIPKDESNYKSILKPRLINLLSDTEESSRVFSTVRSIKDRMLYTKFPKSTLMKRTLDNYKEYYNQTKDTLTDKDKKVLLSLFKQDIKWMISSVSNRIYSGQTLSTIFNLSRFGNDIHFAGTELSKTYRRLMISERIMGFAPTRIHQKWISDLSQFNDSLIKYVFDEDNTTSKDVNNLEI